MAEIRSVGVLGAGVMGRGIAQLFLTAGYAVTLFDTFAGASAAAKAEVAGRITRLAEKGRMTQDAAKAAINKLSVGETLEDLATCDLVIEAIYEDLSAKREILAKLEGVIDDKAVIATNTSSFLVSEVGRDIARANRFLGIHFFNPAPLMRLVELIPGPDTADQTLTDVEALLTRAGHMPVRVMDTNGFLVNQLGRGYVLEAARIVEDGVADYATIDEIATTCLNFPLGPFALMDLTGLDVTYPASVAIFDGNNSDPRYQPPALLRRRYLSGHFGKKNGKGFAQESGVPRIVTPAVGKAALTVLPGHGAIGHPILGTLSEVDDTTSTIVVPLDGRSLAALALEHEVDPRRMVGVDLDFSTDDLLIATQIEGADQARVAAVAAGFDRPAAVTGDTVGSVAQRLVLQLTLIGGDLVTRGIARAEDVNTAAKLALGHREGPLDRARRVGTKRLEQLRATIHAESGEARFRRCRWLIEAAAQEQG